MFLNCFHSAYTIKNPFYLKTDYEFTYKSCFRIISSFQSFSSLKKQITSRKHFGSIFLNNLFQAHWKEGMVRAYDLVAVSNGA